MFAGGLPKQCLRFFVSGFFLPPVALLLWNESRDIPMKIEMNNDLEFQKLKYILFFKDDTCLRANLVSAMNHIGLR